MPPAEPATGDAWRRGAIHVHSRSSYDSLTSHRRLVAIAEAARLDFMLVTDHDTIDGARAVAARAAAADLPLEVPLAAEYRTDHGDLIAAFITREIRSRRLGEFLAEVRGEGGLVLLPHPFHGHRDVERLVAEADLVEVHNGRITAARNAAAVRAAAAHAKPGYHASDAHLARHAARVLVAVRREGSLRDAIAAGDIRPVRVAAVGAGDLVLSQYVKACRRRDARLLARLALGPPYRRARSLTRRFG